MRETATTPCRVCGGPLTAQQARCPVCANPVYGPIHNPVDISWVDMTLAVLMAFLTLAIALPITLLLAHELWRGPFRGGEMVVAVLISTLNVWLIGIPVISGVIHWRNRIQDDDADHAIAIREYWQVQANCLAPIGAILLVALGFYALFRFLG